MSERNALGLLFPLCLIVVLSQISRASVDAAQPHVRNIYFDCPRPIASQLREDDEVVVVGAEMTDTISLNFRSGSDIIQNATSRADMVAIVIVESTSGVLVHDGCWIDTSIRGVVEQVLVKSKRVSILPGQSIETQMSQGELRIGKVLVRTYGPLPPILPGRRYLLFLGFDGWMPDVLTPTLGPLLLADENVVRSMSGEPLNGLLAGLTFRDFVRIIRKTHVSTR